ncbi:voltage-gated potassium channel [Alkalibacillus flavidus]|uniref:Voltage-gated potassium channel n=1 Tax=Alkalibacillus flavidus TaxID=546021 RepID=A0ABV2KT60_9BACI
MSSKIKTAYEVTLFSLALTAVLLMWSDNQTSIIINRIVWIVFVIDFSIRLYSTNDKWRYIKKNPFDLIAIIPFDAIFQLARVARLIRFVRVLLLAKHYFKPFWAIMRTNNLDKVIAFSIILVLLTSIPIMYIEPSIDTYQDALWWSIVTATTVGYGDISPVTGLGRMIAMILMFVGIGLIGMITGSIATYFIKDEASEDHTILHIKHELDRFEELEPHEVDRLITLMQTLKNEKLDHTK